MTLAHWHSTGNYFSYKKHRIFYKTQGKGTPLFLIHGFPTASWDWHKIWDALAAKHTVYALDMIGFGYSDKPTKYSYSFNDQADLWEQFAQENNIQNIHILAHDYGDTVVQELLARFNSRIKKRTKGLNIQSVTLLNGGILQGGYQPRGIQKILASRLGPYLHPFIGKGNLKRTFHNIFGEKKATAEEIDEFWSLIQYNDGKRVLPYIIRYLHERERNKGRWEKALANSHAPLLLINGVEDPISGQNIVDLFKIKVPNGKVVELKKVGHYPQTEAPQLVLKHFFEFLHALK